MASVLEFDLGPFAADPDALLIGRIAEIANGPKDAFEPRISIHHRTELLAIRRRTRRS